MAKRPRAFEADFDEPDEKRILRAAERGLKRPAADDADRHTKRARTPSAAEESARERTILCRGVLLYHGQCQALRRQLDELERRCVALEAAARAAHARHAEALARGQALMRHQAREMDRLRRPPLPPAPRAC